MKNYKLFNEYVIEKETIKINKDSDGVKVYIEEIVIEDFLKLVRTLTKLHLKDDILDFDFEEFYYELIDTLKDEYDSEIDDIRVDKKLIDAIYRELKLTT